jgi:DNA (cytosine-5)-methyltransferase 1
MKKHKKYTSIELFAWAWWMALWMEKAGFKHVLLNDVDKYATETLKLNRPDWNVLHQDISTVDFTEYNWKIDLLTGGFPCQAFSYAWKRMWFEDARWTMFFEFARAVKEIQPKVLLFENVKWFVTHDGGKTIKTVIQILEELRYNISEYKVLNALDYEVPQKRHRIIVVGVQKNYEAEFIYPEERDEKYNLKDAFKAWKLYKTDVPMSEWQEYNDEKKRILEMVPPWGCWRHLPVKEQKEYMGGSYFLWWWKTGMARKISWDEPSLTLTCSPAQKQTERCHPDEIRPFRVREYARIQTFPDSWKFTWSKNQQYKQIGNAVPVNLAYHVGLSLWDLLDKIYNP